MIDFKKKLLDGKFNKEINPIELYKTLDRKSIAGPLRPTQENILNKWFNEHKNDKDLIIKLHTGEGKTLIGLLILQSMVNSKNGPCLYICPNNYLVSQVCLEAKKFGIPFCTINNDTNLLPEEFLSGEKILIINAYKIFNGKSIFGMYNKYIPIDTIILDDSHACIDIIKEAFTISISREKDNELYQKFLVLFSDDLSQQGEGSFIDIQENNDYETFIPVPYWSWMEKKLEVLKILSSNVNNNSIKFVWPLIKNNITEYSCYIAGNKIEITPYNPNVDIFSSFSKANHRILMSATTQDDSFFIKGLSFNINAVNNPLIDNNQKWSGEKMIILPSLMNEKLNHDFIIDCIYNLTKIPIECGIISIVPSTKKSQYYKKLGATILDAQNIDNELNNLKKGNFNKLLVINNRYDGIDLPDENCRILIIDSMPLFDALSDRYEENCRTNSEIINKKIAQKIEQGIGRGVRGEKDYCAILIIGNDIIKFIRSTNTNKYFSIQTQKQIEIGLEIAKMSQKEFNNDENPIKPIISIINQMLERDDGWKEYYISEMNSIKDNIKQSNIYEQLSEELIIEKLYNNQEYEKSCKLMQAFINKWNLDDLDKGWFLQKLARYTYNINKEKSIIIQKQAFKANSQLLKPSIGIEYTKISYIHELRLNRIRNFLLLYKNYIELSLEINSILDNLTFGISADKFENALQLIGELLGFISQRPDKEVRTGPDNLWCGSNNEYLFFECKSEIDLKRISISKKEAGQMNNHCAWFEEQYGSQVKTHRFMIIPTKQLSYEGNFTHEIRIIRKNGLKKLKDNIKNFVVELKPYEISEIRDETLQKLLDVYHLNIFDFDKTYSESYYHLKK